MATAAFCLVVAASLATFPSLLPWMIACWLVAFTLMAARNRVGWLPLVMVLAIVLVKRTYLFPALVALEIAIAAAAIGQVWRLRPRHRDRLRPWRWASVALVWLGWMAVLWQADEVAHRSTIFPLDPKRPIVCLGDSLTSGIAPDGGYPQRLQELLRVPAVDLGREGITIAEGQRLLTEVAKQQPQAVVIELGGHDFLKGANRDTTLRRLLQLVGQVRGLGAEPILVKIPRGFMTDPYAGLERELAHAHDLELVADTPIRRLVIWSPFAPPGMWLRTGHLSRAGLHSNADGNRELARAVTHALTAVFGPQVLRERHEPQAEADSKRLAPSP